MPGVDVQGTVFEELRQAEMIYVDKTAYFHRLAANRQNQKLFFLARPRRFGKSLMLSTFKAIFEGKRELFEGLAIAKTDYDWRPYPVLHFDLSMATGESLESCLSGLNQQVKDAISLAGFKVNQALPREMLAAVFAQLREAGKQAVVLIDEYDAPICHTLDRPELCEAIRGELANFYSVLKGNQAAIRFAMITGISKFASMAVFSGLNNLVDLTYDPDYAAMLGYTQAELEANFGEHLDRRAKEMGLSKADFMAGLAKWFNGYRFSVDSEAKVYNPVAIARTLTSRRKYFDAQWTTTGRSSMLSKFLRRDELLKIDFQRPISASRSSLETPSQIAALSPTAVLYQTGYLTLADYNEITGTYTLRIPDEEVRRDLMAFLCELTIASDATREDARAHVSINSLDDLLNVDLYEMYAQCHYGPTETRIQEYNYQRILQILFWSLGYDPIVEPVQSSGKHADLVVKAGDVIFVFELKSDGTTAEAALQQIKDRGYATPYLHDGRPVAIVGLAFHKGQRELQGVAYEVLASLA
ncbi:MAG: ATP-binding protein [Lentisphaeraceae bacterium]|nr:ATP-binding protein [Lentisphaeraceae bacterium]